MGAKDSLFWSCPIQIPSKCWRWSNLIFLTRCPLSQACPGFKRGASEEPTHLPVPGVPAAGPFLFFQPWKAFSNTSFFCSQERIQWGAHQGESFGPPSIFTTWFFQDLQFRFTLLLLAILQLIRPDKMQRNFVKVLSLSQLPYLMLSLPPDTWLTPQAQRCWLNIFLDIAKKPSLWNSLLGCLETKNVAPWR